MTELYIGTIGISAVVVALIGLAKQWFGMPTSWAPWVNFGLQLFFFAVIGLLGLYPEWVQPVGVGLNILVSFLAAAGFYDRYQAISG